MKNYWLQLHDKRKGLWTIEFENSGSFILGPTKIDLLNDIDLLNNKNEKVSILFKKILISNNDKEFNNFLKIIKNTMGFYTANLIKYHDIFKKVDCFQLYGLRLDNINNFFNDHGDIKLSFYFSYSKHYKFYE